MFNPESGKGIVAKQSKMIVALLSQKFDVELILSKYKGHIYDTILKKGESIDLFVVAGGDGTLSEAVNGVCHLNKKPRIGYIPCGTVNDVAHSLLIPRNIKRAVKNILEGEPFAHDAIKIDDRFGVYVCCGGALTETSYSTSQKSKKALGKVAYGLHGMKNMLDFSSFEATLKTDSINYSQQNAFFMVLNSRYVASFRVNKKTKLNDGLVDVVMIKNSDVKVGFKGIFRIAKLLLHGLKPNLGKNYAHFVLDKFKFETCEDLVINLDGEAVKKGNFDFKVEREAFEIIVPKKFIKLTKSLTERESCHKK